MDEQGATAVHGSVFMVDTPQNFSRVKEDPKKPVVIFPLFKLVDMWSLYHWAKQSVNSQATAE